MLFKNYLLLIICFLIWSCSFIQDSEVENNVENNDLKINNILFNEIEKQIKEEDIEEIKIEESEIDEPKVEESRKTEIPSSRKILDVKFYSQFPSRDYGLPFDEYCEEASLLNGIYYLTNRTPTIDEYLIDLNIIKEMEDKLFWINWYKNTSIKQTNLILQLFQNQDSFDIYLNTKTEEKKEELIQTLTQKTKYKGWVLWKIIYNPTINDLTNAINRWSPVILPVYWRGINNIYFTPPWPVYHNILLKWYDLENFIFNEVWTIRGDGYVYSKNLIMNNIHDFVKELYPENYLLWDSKALILYK